MNAECKLVKHDELEDHIMFIGVSLDIRRWDYAASVLSQCKYRKLDEAQYPYVMTSDCKKSNWIHRGLYWEELSQYN